MFLRLGKNMRRALKFAQEINGWHSFDSTVKKAIIRLSELKLVEVNEFNQFRITEIGKCISL